MSSFPGEHDIDWVVSALAALYVHTTIATAIPRPVSRIADIAQVNLCFHRPLLPFLDMDRPIHTDDPGMHGRHI